MELENSLYYIYYTFLGIPFIIRVSIFAFSIFIPMYLLGIYSFLRYRRAYYKGNRAKQRLAKKYKEQLYAIITSEKHLFYEDFDRLLDTEITKLNKRGKERLILLLSAICKDAPAINFENNQNLLNYLNIQRFLEKRLKHGNALQKQNILRSNDDLQSKVSATILASLTQDRNVSLRKRARSSYLRFTSDDPFRFLEEDFDEDLNCWDKIELHYILEKRVKNGRLPNLARWVLSSDNLDFKCFMVDEIAFFNQYENATSLIHLVKDIETHSMLRLHCIKALGQMQYREAEYELLKIYPMQPVRIQHAIIHVIGSFSSGESLDFLKEAYEKALGDEQRIMILSTIYRYGTKGKEYFNEMERKQTQEQQSLIFKHVSNPLLSII